MKVVTIHEAKTHLSRLLREVEAGETIIIARGKTEIARLAGIGSEARPKTGADAYGAWAHLGAWTEEAERILMEPAYTEQEWDTFLQEPDFEDAKR
ncbi:type II toxin-antitoxin system Phd/YefM family antitoxin [Maricaulaceae bacterium MS644]